MPTAHTPRTINRWNFNFFGLMLTKVCFRFQYSNTVPFQIALGFSQGIMPLVSYTYASGNHKRMKDTILFAVKLMLPAMVAVTAEPACGPVPG